MKSEVEIYQSCLSAFSLLQAKADGPSLCANACTCLKYENLKSERQEQRDPSYRRGVITQ